MSDKNDDYDLGREIERSWLFRGEYDKAFQARGIAYLIVIGLCILAAFITLIIDSLGVKW